MNKDLLNYFNGDELAANVWLSKYALESQNIQHSYNNNLRIKNSHEFFKLVKHQIDEIRNMYNTGNYT